MTKAEKQKRNKEILGSYVTFMQYTIPDHREAVETIGPAVGLSSSTIRRIVGEAQKACQHKFFRPYKLDKKYRVCKKCWKQP